MLDVDRERFGAMWKGAWEIHGKGVTTNMLSIAFAALRQYEIREIEKAITAHIRDPQAGQFPIKPADVIRFLDDPSQDGRPDANAAWAMCPRDEAITVVWTDEMAAAWGIAQPLITDGDMTAARMAFRDAYDQACKKARETRQPPKWRVSLGHAKDGREGPILAAVERGQLRAEHAMRLLPYDNPRLMAFVESAQKALQKPEVA